MNKLFNEDLRLLDVVILIQREVRCMNVGIRIPYAERETTELQHGCFLNPFHGLLMDCNF